MRLLIIFIELYLLKRLCEKLLRKIAISLYNSSTSCTVQITDYQTEIGNDENSNCLEEE